MAITRAQAIEEIKLGRGVIVKDKNGQHRHFTTVESLPGEAEFAQSDPAQTAAAIKRAKLRVAEAQAELEELNQVKEEKVAAPALVIDNGQAENAPVKK